MGNNPNSGDVNKEILNNKLIFVKQINNIHYGDVKIYKYQQGSELYALKQKLCTSKQDFDKSLQEIQNYKKISHKNLIQIGDVRMQHEDQLCSNVFMIQYFYQFIERDLKEEIVMRQRQGQKFSQTEILIILKQILSALLFLKSKQIYHQSVMPQNILLSDNFEAKLYIPIQMTGQTHYKKLLLGLDSECYLSPELFVQYTQSNITPSADLEKADVFSVGLTGLQMTVSTDLNLVYDIIQQQFNDQVLSQNLQQAADLYSPNLAQLLQEFMLIDPGSRPNFESALMKVEQLLNSNSNQVPNDNSNNIANNNVNNIYPNNIDNNNANIPHISPQHQSLSPNQKLIQQQRQKSISPQKVSQGQSPVLKSNEKKTITNEQKVISPGKKSGYQSTQKVEQNLSPVQMLDSSLKQVDDLVNEAVQKSLQTRNRYETSQLKQFMNSLLTDEIFIPLNSTPVKSNQLSKPISNKPSLSQLNMAQFENKGKKK